VEGPLRVAVVGALTRHELLDQAAEGRGAQMGVEDHDAVLVCHAGLDSTSGKQWWVVGWVVAWASISASRPRARALLPECSQTNRRRGALSGRQRSRSVTARTPKYATYREKPCGTGVRPG